jgi:hypothetical protein
MFEIAELAQLDVIRKHPNVRSRILTEVDGLPIWEISIGAEDETVPTLGLYAGIHGNERIGSQVLLAWLEHTLSCLAWDSSLQDRLTKMRIVAIPLINVTGLRLGTRHTSTGVDLMRNAPIDAQMPYIWPLAGQKISRHLPWYRGTSLAPESQALIDSVMETRKKASFMMAMDLHSGFGSQDRLWFPYAAHRLPPPHLAEAVALCDLFNQNYPLHDFYTIEPQSIHYTTHGDLWDYLYDSANQDGGTMLLPYTLELGSWLWLRKNPRQFFQRFGLFHPMLPHRLRRVLRQHWTILDFLMRATADYDHWLPDQPARLALRQVGIDRWYQPR